MRLVVRILGREVLALELDHSEPAPIVEDGPPFGFTGSAGGVAELADPWPADEVVCRGR
ncbi:hypothetical protein [Actinomadura sp. KC06]|uniref:hypothetical protein n=1 Tax=Actinomadura sp. KC06 TaxID=2530369 RepID=UPI00140494F5|nr:hypothetical protein [Actinomadura sp. KC06]